MAIEASQILQAVARIARKKPEQLEPQLTLASAGVNSSFGLSALRALLEQAGCPRIEHLHGRMTIAELTAVAQGKASGMAGAPAVASPSAAAAASTTTKAVTQAKAAPTPAATAAPRPAAQPMQAASSLSFDNLGLGMDMQEITALPLAADLRADPFYAAHFTPAELATAALRPDPRAHLCGVFCAKEAAKKSHPALLDLRMDAFEVRPDAQGKPQIRLRDASRADAFDFMLSITHTAQVAAATCITRARQLQEAL